MKILVVDDHVVVRHGLRLLLGRIPGASIVDASNIAEAELICADAAPDVVVLDLNLAGQNGIEFARRCKEAKRATRIVVFSMHNEPVYAQRAFAAGIFGYVAKTSKPEELLTAVRRALQGERHLDPTIAQAFSEGAAIVNSDFDGLSGREREILELIGDGKSMTEIAAILGVAYKTVANTSLRLRDKLGAKGLADLVRIAIEMRDSK